MTTVPILFWEESTVNGRVSFREGRSANIEVLVIGDRSGDMQIRTQDMNMMIQHNKRVHIAL